MKQINIGILAPDGIFTPCESYRHLDLSAEIAEEVSGGGVFCIPHKSTSETYSGL